MNSTLKIIGRLLKSHRIPCLGTKQRQLCCKVSEDLEKYAMFASPDVQTLLGGLSKNIPEITLPNIADKENANLVKLMTDEELEEARKKAKESAAVWLQMPPVLPPRTEINVKLARNPEIADFSPHNHVFVDTSVGLHERDRSMVVREPDGTLRLARWDERDRLSQIYYPRNGRRIKPAPLFRDDYRQQRLIEEGKYRYLLDNACAQFEPDDHAYIQICHELYAYIDEHEKYDAILSTRHYGPMIYTLTLQNKITSYLLYILRENREDDVLRLACLYSAVHQNRIVNPDDLITPEEKRQILKGMIEQLNTSQIELQQLQTISSSYFSEEGEDNSEDDETSSDSSSSSSDEDEAPDTDEKK